MAIICVKFAMLRKSAKIPVFLCSLIPCSFYRNFPLNYYYTAQMLAKLVSGMHKPAQQTVVPSSSVQDFLASLPVKKM